MVTNLVGLTDVASLSRGDKVLDKLQNLRWRSAIKRLDQIKCKNESYKATDPWWRRSDNHTDIVIITTAQVHVEKFMN